MIFSRFRWRLVFWYGLLVLAITLTMTVIVTRMVYDVRLRGLRSALESEVLLGASLSHSYLDQGPTAQAFASLVSAKGLEGYAITLLDPEGTVLADSERPSEEMRTQRYKLEIQRALSKGLGSDVRYDEWANEERLYAAAPIRGEQGLLGVLRLATSLQPVRQTVARVRRVLLLAGLVSLGVTAWVSIMVGDGMARPLERLRAGADSVARDDLDVHIISTTRDETGALVRAFNRMLDRLRVRVKRLTGERVQLTTILEHMADGLLITDGEGLIRLVNPAALGILELSEEHVVGRSLPQVIREHQIIALWRGCKERRGEGVELIEVDEEQFLQVIVSPLEAMEEGGCLVIIQDLSQVKHLETARRDFVSNISHELRTPLASLRALSETLREGALEDPPAAKHFLDRMEGEIDALTQMVEELLELSRIESGKVPLRLSAAPVHEIVLPPLERLEPQIERAELTLVTDLPGDLPPVLADRQRLGRVITNLVHNAIKFTPAGGRITVSAQEAGSYVRISVEDNGIGIAREDTGRIFERFYKADRSRSGGGTGLGLAIAKHIVQAHGGRIWVRSREGEGSNFTFTLLKA